MKTLLNCLILELQKGDKIMQEGKWITLQDKTLSLYNLVYHDKPIEAIEFSREFEGESYTVEVRRRL